MRTQLRPRLDRPEKAPSSLATAFRTHSATLTRQIAQQAHFPRVSGTSQRKARASQAIPRRYIADMLRDRLGARYAGAIGDSRAY